MKKKTHNSKSARNIYLHFTSNLLIGILLITIALFIGMLGYHSFEKMTWVDAFINASMILSGMGPVTTLTNNSSKLFAGFYALFSGLAFIAIVAVILSPIIHRFFRKIHLQNKQDE